MDYISTLISELNYYTTQGYIPELKVLEMTYKEMEKIVYYCFSIEQNISFEDFIKNTNLGYNTTEKTIKKIIEKRKCRNII